MKEKLLKYWPSIAHTVAIGILFLNPAVQQFALTHPAYAGMVGLAWGYLLHLAQSPVK